MHIYEQEEMNNNNYFHKPYIHVQTAHAIAVFRFIVNLVT